jgi:dipeptidyl aminopeptidase/acylaminoacyl peptidase
MSQAVTAYVDGAAGVIFTAAVHADRPEAMTILAGNNQTAGPGAVLPNRLQVKVVDQFQNPVVGEPVSFTVVLGHGAIAGDSATTDASGAASSGAWTLGSEGGQIVSAAAGGKQIIFEAFACADICAPDLLFVRGDSLYHLADGVTTALFGTTDAGAEIDGPIWSPNGQQIAFSVYSWPDDESFLYLMDADGSHLTLRASGFSAPSWSPDGAHLAANGPSGIYVLSVQDDGVPPVLLTEGGIHPAWSPDGTRIAFISGTSLRVMNADGSAATTLVAGNQAGDGQGHFKGLTWSHDGLRLAFVKCTPRTSGSGSSYQCNVFVAPANGASLAQLTTVDNASGVAWSPDGTRIAFNSDGNIVWVPGDVTFPVSPLPLVTNGAYAAWRP